MSQMIQSIDWAVLRAVQTVQCGFLDKTMPVVTLLSEYGILWILLSVVLLIFPKTRRCGVTLAIGLLLAFLLGNLLLKPLVARPRPYMLDSGIVLIVPYLADFSFPSGHTYSAVACGVILLRYYPKWGVVVLVISAVVGFSRLYLQMHFLSDVLGGALLGALCAGAALFIVSRLPHKNKE